MSSSHGPISEVGRSSKKGTDKLTDLRTYLQKSDAANSLSVSCERGPFFLKNDKISFNLSVPFG